MEHARVYTLPFIWGRTVWIITSLYFIFAVAIIALLVRVIAMGGVVGGVIGLVITLPILLGIVIYSEGYSPQRLELWQDRVVVLRRYDSVIIQRSDILSVTPLTKRDMRYTYNLGGCGGLFGYFGRFTNRQLGVFDVYSTTMNNLFLFRLIGNKQIVVECAEPKKMESFIAVSE